MSKPLLINDSGVAKIKCTDCQSAIEELKAAKETFDKISHLLSGCAHTGFPVSVRELDGSISQCRPKTLEGEAYDEAKSLAERIEKFLKENE